MDKRSLLFIICVTTAFMGIKSWYANKYEQDLKEWKESNEQTLPPPEASIEPSPAAEVLPEETSAEEQYFFLETPYQQIVFSSIGGAITEINLPFKGPTAPKSVVLPIEIDRKLEEETNSPLLRQKELMALLQNLLLAATTLCFVEARAPPPA